MNKIIKIILLPRTGLKKFLVRYDLTLNYYFISIAVMLLFTFLLIKIIGDNILRHEAYVFKTEFIKKNELIVRQAGDKIVKYFEELDTLSIVDLVEKLGKEDNAVYAYVLNNSGEVIAHTEKPEMFKKYIDKFVDIKHLNYFLNQMNKVWNSEKEFHGRDIIKFSKPIILQFTKEDILKELTGPSQTPDDDENLPASINSNKGAGPITNKKEAGKMESDIYKKFYIAGALHIAFSTDKLQMIEQFSKKKVLIFYCIAYLLAILIGYLAGKHFEDSVNCAVDAVNSIIKDKDQVLFKTEERIDSFKKLQIALNRLMDDAASEPVKDKKPMKKEEDKAGEKTKKEDDKPEKKSISSRLRRI